jgi:hypothetical protein
MITNPTMTTYQRWPFLPASTHTPEQRQQWWQECFVATPEVARFVHAEASAVLIGGPGSGKSTAVAALQHILNEPLLLIPYPPYHWPSGARHWVPSGNHLSQILAAAATEITRRLSDAPETYLTICQEPHCRQFLLWLIETYLGRRMLGRLQHRLRQSLNPTTSTLEQPEKLYATTSREADVWNQLDELVYLSEALGYKRIIVTIDLNAAEAIPHLEDLRNLFGWLDLFEYPEFAIRAAIPQSANDLLHLAEQGNGRFDLITTRPNEIVTEDIISRHLQIASNGACNTLLELTSRTVLERAKDEILKLYGIQALSGWLQWAETLLVIANQSNVNHDPDETAYHFYQRHVPMRLETNLPGVWRGPQFIALDQQPYELIKKLFELRGRPAPDALQDLAGSGPNLNTLASRLRKQIEPLPGKNIYLHNRRDRGYWLENFLL